MLRVKSYVPILKAKEGEMKAISSLGLTARSQITPHFDIPPMDWDRKKNRYARTLESHLENKARKIQKTWGNDDLLFVDLEFDSTIKASDGRNRLLCAYNLFSQTAMKIVYATHLDAEAEYNLTLKDIVATEERGICVRIFRGQMVDGTKLKQRLGSLLSLVNCNPGETSLLLDFQFLPEPDLESCVSLAKRALTAISSFSEFRSVTLAGSSMPENLSGLEPDSITPIKRAELELWRRVTSDRPR